MKKPIYIIGAGGHTRSLINLLELNNIKILGVYDERADEIAEVINGHKVIGKLDDVPKDAFIVLSIGDNKKRAYLFNRFKIRILKDNLIHPTAYIEKRTKLGIGNQIFANVYLNSNVVIGDNNILNTNSIIEHEGKIGNNNHISVSTILCGRVTVGNDCFIGAGTIVNDGIKVCDGVIIGSNSTVINNVISPGTYVGNPVRKLK